MQDFSRQLHLLNEFYNRHKQIIDALAKDDEMFRAIKENICEYPCIYLNNDMIENNFGWKKGQPLNILIIIFTAIVESIQERASSTQSRKRASPQPGAS